MDRSPVRGAARLAAILDSLPEALLLADATGRVVNANAVALGWFEVGGPPLVGQLVTELLSGYGTAVARVADPNTGRWSDGSGTEGSGAKAPGEPERMVGKRIDGSTFPAEVVRSSLPPAHGSLEVVVIRDVTGIADSEQELRRQQRQTELILRAASEGIVGVDTAGRIVLVNPAAARILGYRASELGGREFHTLSTTGGADSESPVLDTLRTGRKHRLGAESNTVVHTKDGQSVPVELSTVPVLEGEALVGAVVTFVDVSRFQSLAVVAQPTAAATGGGPNGVHSVSAEAVSALRKPLDAARAELSRLADADEGLSPTARHHLAHVTAELAEATRLVDDLVDAATGLSGLRKRPAELSRVVHAATDAATDLSAAAGIDLAVHTSPAEVVIDAERLTQAVRHLLVDTVQASPRGSTVVVAAARRGPIARIEIRGVEIGSVPEHLGFARVVVERHGGTVSVHRAEGRGVTYVIELPTGTDEPQAAQLSQLSQFSQGQPAGTNRALIGETQIIPLVREIADGSPQGSQNARGVDGARTRTGNEAAAAIPRQPTPVGNASPVFASESVSHDVAPNWFDADTRFADSNAANATAAADRQTTAAAVQSQPAGGTVSPRGRRRASAQAAAQQLQHLGGDDANHGYLAGGVNVRPVDAYQEQDYGDSYLIQQVDSHGSHSSYGSGSGDLMVGAASLHDTGEYASGDFGASRPAPAGSLYDTGDHTPTANTVGRQPSGYSTVATTPVTSMYDTGDHTRAANTANRQDTVYGPAPSAPVAPVTSLYDTGDHTRSANALNPRPPAASLYDTGDHTMAADTANRPTGHYGTPAPVPTTSLYDTGDYTPAANSATGGYAAPPRPQPLPRAWPNPDAPDYTVPQPPAFAQPQSQPQRNDAIIPPTLLVWPAPEASSVELLQAQGYAPTALKTPSQLTDPGPSRPVALLADPVGVPVTRAALHTLRAAAADSGIPLFVTAGLGAVPAATLAATARRGADPSALLRALTPEQIAAPRVLLVEENPDLAAAFAISLERDGMRVLQASSEVDAVTALAAEQPQLVVMNLTLIRRRRSGVVDWLRAYERLHLAPIVLYTAPATMAADVELLRALRSGAAAVHLTDREIGPESANRLLDLLGKVAD